MAMAFIFEADQFSLDQCDGLMSEMGLNDDSDFPEGLIAHLAGLTVAGGQGRRQCRGGRRQARNADEGWSRVGVVLAAGGLTCLEFVGGAAA